MRRQDLRELSEIQKALVVRLTTATEDVKSNILKAIVEIDSVLNKQGVKNGNR